MREQNRPDRIRAEKMSPAPDDKSSDRTDSQVPDEGALFGGDPSPRLFGEGSYAEGGSNEEGNWETRETHPHGLDGDFSDAGGYGATELLGEPGFGGKRSSATADTAGKPAADSQKGGNEPEHR